MVRTTKKALIGVRVDEELKQQVEALAATEERSLSAWIVLLLKREVAKQPLTPPPPTQP